MIMSNTDNVWGDLPEEKEALAKTSGEKRDLVSFSPVQGDNKLRIVGSYKFFKEHWVGKVKRTPVCPGKGCPICEHPDKQVFFDKARALRDAGKEEEAKALFRKVYATYDPRPCYAVNVIDRADGQIKIWKFSRTVKEMIAAIAKNYGDPNNYDVTVNRKGKGTETKYTVIADRENSALTDEEKQLKVFNLAMIYKAASIDKISAYLRGELPKRAESGNETPKHQAPEPETPIADLGDLNLGNDLDDLDNLDTL
jgi:hypothetical protein